MFFIVYSLTFSERGLRPAVTSFVVTNELIQPIVDAINSGLNVLVPVGIGIMGTFIGIRLVRRVIFTFL